jgi:hypothetical protein
MHTCIYRCCCHFFLEYVRPVLKWRQERDCDVIAGDPGGERYDELMMTRPSSIGRGHRYLALRICAAAALSFLYRLSLLQWSAGIAARCCVSVSNQFFHYASSIFIMCPRLGPMFRRGVVDVQQRVDSDDTSVQACVIKTTEDRRFWLKDLECSCWTIFNS